MLRRSCGSVIAGTFFFHSSSLDGEEPGGDQAECLVVMPTSPMADFVVGQTGFTLGPLEAVLDAMFGLRGLAE